MIQVLKDKVLNGGEITYEEALSLLKEDKEELYTAAAEITRRFGKPYFDSCSIINARSGKCPENCKWCAQSAHFKTAVETYDVVSEEECLKQALYNEQKGIGRFSLVTSGRAVKGRAMEKICRIYQELNSKTDIYLCASLGLLNKEELTKLRASGVKRYHCNLETAPSYFKELCTTHTTEDKMQTLKWAKELGFQLCCGGIIGMGETAEQRVELAMKLREVEPDSIPINILAPVPGTPLEHTAPISDEDILTTIAIFRFVHPRTEIRFAGGRARLSHDVQLKAIEIGINGAVSGDLLTTVGNGIDADKKLAQEAGFNKFKA